MPTKKDLENSRRRRENRLAWCFGCTQEKPWEEFDPSPGRRPFGLSSRCRECDRRRKAELVRRSREALGDKQRKERDRRGNLRKLGLSPEDYDRLQQVQQGLCAICGKPETVVHHITGEPGRLAVDHCHETGVIRGLLCQRCNKGLGLFLDDPALLQQAAAYIEAPHGVRTSRKEG